jgi:hypothetical protein
MTICRNKTETIIYADEQSNRFHVSTNVNDDYNDRFESIDITY